VRFDREGVVSVWIGSFVSENDLLDYADWKYDEKGDSASAFASHSGLGWFDHDFQEANFLGAHPSRPREALGGHSYVESFGDAVAEALAHEQTTDWNSLFLLYDCAYDPERAHPSRACRLRYVGTFPYSKGAGPGGTESRVRRVE
jgi:hypothetical protein